MSCALGGNCLQGSYSHGRQVLEGEKTPFSRQQKRCDLGLTPILEIIMRPSKIQFTVIFFDLIYHRLEICCQI